MNDPRTRCRLRRAARPAAIPLAAGLLSVLGAAAAQDVGAPSDFDDPRPPVAAYVITDAAGVEAPLGGAVGDAARGRALFADPETGGCIACHAAPGLARIAVAPRILRDRVDPLPPPAPPPAAETGDASPAEADPAPPASDSDSRMAPREALLAVPRPADLTPDEAGASGDGPDGPDDDVAGGPADAQGPPAPEEPAAPVFPGDDEPDRPQLLPVPAGPDLTGVAARLSSGALRLWVIDPRAFGAGHAMPGYHAVSEPLGLRRPAYRQPWFTPAQVEDMVAYLETLSEPQ